MGEAISAKLQLFPIGIAGTFTNVQGHGICIKHIPAFVQLLLLKDAIVLDCLDEVPSDVLVRDDYVILMIVGGDVQHLLLRSHLVS